MGAVELSRNDHGTVGRIDSLDLIRGVAICGLVPINILDFASPDDWVFTPAGITEAETGIWIFLSVFGMGKFVSLFSILFGASILLQTRSYENRGKDVTKHYLPRLGWLWVFGMIHGYLIWWGDILVGYAVTGFIVFWCRNWSAKTLAVVGSCIQFLAAFAVSGVIVLVVLLGDLEILESEIISEEEIPFWDDNVLSGSWIEQMPVRAAFTVLFQVFGIPFFIAPFCGSMMLVGMSLLKSGFFELKWKRRSYQKLMSVGVCGLVLALLGVVLSYREGWTDGVVLKYSPLGLIATPLITMGYAVLLVLWGKRSTLSWLQCGFRATGRMAFSNYIGQSIIFTLIFYGTGFGLYGKMSFTSVLMICPLVWIFQMIISTLWLRRFRFGPLEWVWRHLARRGGV